MPRHMSFFLTQDQMRARSKTVTRRFGWKFLSPADILWAVEKGHGLKKGEQVKKIGLIEVVSTRWEPLNAITQEDVSREGFPDWSPEEFVSFLVKHHKCPVDEPVHRIEFKHIQSD